MNEQVEQKANELLLSLIDKAQSGVEFAEAQIPDVVEQLLVWNVVVSGIWTCVALLILGGLVMLLWSVYRVERDEAGDIVRVGVGRCRDGSIDEDSILPMALISLVVCVVGLVILGSSMDWLKIWIAPKLYLLEYAASLAK